MCVAVLVLNSCASPGEPIVPSETQETTVSDAVMLSISEALPSLPASHKGLQLEFNLELLKELSAIGDNVFFSSLSINQALSMVYFGAEDETRKEMQKVLGYDDMDITDVASYQKALIESFNNSGDTTFNNANSIWIDDKITVRKNYMDTMDDVFDTETYNIDLQDTNAVDKVNSWIDKKTNSMIEKLYEKEDNPFAMASMVLVNAIYFKGEWTTPFDSNRTHEGDFFGKTTTSKVDMMSSSDSVLGFENDTYKAVKLPYGDDERFAMIAVLPNSDINTFTQNLDSKTLESILNDFEEKDEAILRFPKFEMEEKVSLNDTLKALGMNKVFTDTAELGLIAETALMIDEVLHKAKIKVDEEGTEAAAVTGITLKNTAMPVDQFEFIADKPFLLFIVDTENELVLFTGMVCDLE